MASGSRPAASALLLLAGVTAAQADPPRSRVVTIGRVCDIIAVQAGAHRLPPDFLARLIWKESRFDAEAVSPAGAEGIAQFMPGTARMRGLADSFDVEQALPASAGYLAALRDRFGNLGLAAAAYNAGENRVSRWLASGGFMPLETEDYVLGITGEPVDAFAEASHAATIPPLAKDRPFAAACRDLPVTEAAIVPMAHILTKPWAVQVAGNFRRSAAVRSYERMRGRLARQLGAYEPVVSRVRSPLGRRGIYAVRVGADNRAGADEICNALHRAGGSCVVMRNR